MSCAASHLIGRILTVSLASVIASAGYGQCGEGTGVCWEPHAGPGCVLVECCESVCGFAPHCCETNWDQSCADLAIDICDWVTCGTPGSCTSVHEPFGCEDITCCQLLCPFDSYCCFTRWDEFCVEQAERLCGVPACEIAIPAEAVDENEPCYERLNDGCNRPETVMIDVLLPAVRRGTHASGAPRDTDWSRVPLDRPTRLRVELAAEFPGQILLVEGPCLGPLVVHAEAVCVPCGATSFEIDRPAGTYAVIVSAASPGRMHHTALTCDLIDPDNPPDPKDPPPTPSPFGLRYALTITEVPPGLLGDLDGDGAVGQTDLALLLGAWGSTGLGDLDGDGTVGSTDLAILLGAWSPQG
jgi:hypothetical protein